MVVDRVTVGLLVLGKDELGASTRGFKIRDMVSREDKKGVV